MGLKTMKNFITTNAVQNITSVPKQPGKIYVDTRRGDKNSLEPSGLEPVYIHKKINFQFRSSKINPVTYKQTVLVQFKTKVEQSSVKRVYL